MSPNTSTKPGEPHGLHRLAALAQRLTPHSLLALVARVALAGIFWASARTKVDGWFTISDGAYALFREGKAGGMKIRDGRVVRDGVFLDDGGVSRWMICVDGS